MKTIASRTEPVNVIVGKDPRRNLYEAVFDSRQTTPRVGVGSAWLAVDRRYERRYVMRVVETGYVNTGAELERILAQLRENSQHPFDERALEYYCAERAWLSVEGELTTAGYQEAHDQPTVYQTFLRPTDAATDALIAAPDPAGGFAVGFLRSGSQDSRQPVTAPDRFVGHRTLITGSSGFGKSTLVRNLARHWLEQQQYGTIIDDLKGEYLADIIDESSATVSGLCHHPEARQRLYLLTSYPVRFEGEGLEEKIAGIIPLRFGIQDVPPTSLKDVATHPLSGPQSTFLEMYQDQPDLFPYLLRRAADGSPDTSGWQKRFLGFISLTKEAKKRLEESGGLDDEDYPITPADIVNSTYTPIHAIIRQLNRLASRPYMSANQSQSCLPQIRELLKSGATIILDKSGLTDADRMIISTIIANHLYTHNERYSSGNRQVRARVIPFVYLVEEAHLLLSKEKVMEGSVFVNFAKTGRSFQIGLIAVTQRPSSIEANILTQFDNYITLRLTNSRDVKDLIEACPAFEGYEGDVRSMGRGAALIAMGEPLRVQSVKVFAWTEARARTLLRTEQASLLEASEEVSNLVPNLMSGRHP